jgi:predicted DsbA family dithiol-disulfide isomerase
MQVEVWSDVVCPWCYIGKRRLDEALAAFPGGDDVVVVHRAFQLDPKAVSDGRRTVDVIAEKYGTDPAGAAAMMANVTEVAATVGLSYRLLDTVSGNTRDAHRLVLWAQAQGQSAELLESMYSGYFEQARDIFTTEALCELAAEAGLDSTEARAMLSTTAFIDDVAADQALAAQFGATGVPFFVFDRAYGISGAQPLEAFAATLERAAQGPPE